MESPVAIVIITQEADTKKETTKTLWFIGQDYHEVIRTRVLPDMLRLITQTRAKNLTRTIEVRQVIDGRDTIWMSYTNIEGLENYRLPPLLSPLLTLTLTQPKEQS